MDGLELTNPMFWVSIVLGGIIVAAVSYGFQMAQDSEATSKEFNVKGAIRDLLLGGIFTAMAWTLVPDTMKSITNSVSSSASSAVSSATNAVATATQSGGSTTTVAPVTTQTLSGDVDIQVGPPRF